MDETTAAVSTYLQETLGEAPRLEEAKTSSLPFLLSSRYEFKKMELFNKACLLMTVHHDFEGTGELRKHAEVAEKVLGLPVVIAIEGLNSSERKRLILQGVSFIVPGNQMFLPRLGMDLREHFKPRKRSGAEGKPLAPATQAILIAQILHGWTSELSQSGLVGPLPYSAMTISRAFKELEEHRLGRRVTRGRERLIQFYRDARGTWEAARSVLRNPIMKEEWVGAPSLKSTHPDTRLSLHEIKKVTLSGWVAAGESALASRSMLAEPKTPVFAASEHTFNDALRVNDIKVVQSRDEAFAKVQVWSYGPVLSFENHEVDPLSLYLSLRGSKDERVAMALDEMLEEFKW
ncbi:hypothetical protein FBY21_2074 [Pseudomonas sp. SLBN-26]|uniref:hypothetical protein n=1 Tax=Pseudomonadaceae TaxID=135621 RepID=UPI001151B8D4|nr:MULTISPECIES: hypothetical protein [Pseudomonas]MCP1617466.1 hypothetical protein [Pseudomonas otitidis]TQL06706.1 hypothetical protein FBY21_2074 [Pseudomonas sp. SLBN-26]